MTLPAAADPWWHGLRDSFYLAKAPCLFGAPVTLEASVVGQVYADACQWRGTAVAADTPAALAEAFGTQDGHVTIGPVDATIAGYAAKRFEIPVPADFDATACSDGTIQLWDGRSMDPGQTMTVYLVDVDGLTLGVTGLLWNEDATPAILDELDSIVASLRIQP